LDQERGLDFGYETPGLRRFRVSVYYEQGVMGLVGRLVPDDVPTLEEVRLPSVVRDLLARETGLIIVVGLAGTGKSTSLAAMVNHINQSRAANIITLEDPVEYIFSPDKSLIKQRELGVDIPSFPVGLRQALRQDPNVIMVGEMRDLETISTAVSVAETGHLVLATLHTADTGQTIERITDAFPAGQQEQIRVQLSKVLAGIVAQKLIPAVDGSRIVVHETLINIPAIANLIRENNVSYISNVLQTHSDLGMRSFDQALAAALDEGRITRDTALRYLVDESIID